MREASNVTRWCCCKEHGVTENDICSSCDIHGDKAPDLKNLLQEAHDKMDDFNAKEYFDKDTNFCFWCDCHGYDGNGLIHTEDCILVRLRKVLA